MEQRVASERTRAPGRDGAEQLTLGVVMVTYNSARHIVAAVEAARRAFSVPARIVVVDNASADDTVALVSSTGVDVIEADSNLGFARACNVGAMAAGDPEFLLFLNPDSLVDRGAVDRAIAALRQDATVGALGGRTRYADGTLNPTSCFARPTLWSAVCYASGLASVFRGSHLFNPEAMGGWDRDDTRDVDVVTGCFLLTRTALFRELAGFDERFFLYSEDTDLSQRIRARGYRCVHAHEVGLVHIGGGSDTVKAEKLAKVFRARRQYYDKHWSPPAARAGGWLLDVAVALRLAASSVRSTETRTQWRAIWKAREMWHNDPASADTRSSEVTRSPGGVTGATASRGVVGVSPPVRLSSRPFETRARIGYRVLRHVQRSARRGDRDFVGQGLATAVRLPWLMVSDLARRDVHECNVCGWVGSTFYPNTGPGYHEQGVTCPGCSSLDRHRSLLALLIRSTDMFDGTPEHRTRVVEVAPMRGFEALMQVQPALDYTSFDLERHAMERGDITAMHYPSDSVDYFICFHVLEHIPDAAAALGEIRRVLTPGGAAILQVPVDWDAPLTREYDAPDPRDVGHVRQYGRDFPDHLRAAGLEVTSVSVEDVLPAEVLSRFGLSTEPIFVARKPAGG